MSEEVQRSAAAVDAVRRISRTPDGGEGDGGISAAQLFVLSTLDSGAGSSLTPLSERTHTDQPRWRAWWRAVRRRGW